MSYAKIGPFGNKVAPPLNAEFFNALEDGVLAAHQDTTHVASAADKTALAAQAAAGQTADIAVVKNSAGVVLWGIGPTGQTRIGSGDQLSMDGVQTTAAQVLQIRKGTAASPDTSPHPLLKVERTVNVPEASVAGTDGAEIMAAISGQAKGVGNCVQPVGVYGGASTVAVSGNFDDACGGYFTGTARSPSTGGGIGVFALGKTESAAAGTGAAGLDVSCYNNSGAHIAFNQGGESNASAIHVTAFGSFRSSAAIQIGKPSVDFTQFSVGIGIPTNNPIKDATFWDRGNADRSIYIEGGAHAAAAIAIAAGSGGIAIGETAVQVAGSLLEIQAPVGTSPNLVSLWSSNPNDQFAVFLSNGSGSHNIAMSGSAGGWMTGTVAGDLALKANSGTIHLGGDVSVIKVQGASLNKLGFFGAAAVAQKTGWGLATGTATRTTFATGSVTLVQLAERVKALIDDLHQTAGYGLLGT